MVDSEITIFDKIARKEIPSNFVYEDDLVFLKVIYKISMKFHIVFCN